MSVELKAHEHRVAFVRCIGLLIQWAQRQGLALAFDEGMIESPRRVWSENDATALYTDARYSSRSYHYRGLALDLVLYREGEMIMDLSHPSWMLLAEKWEMLHLLCTSGARKIANGANADRLCPAGIRHISFGEGSKVYPLPWRH